MEVVNTDDDVENGARHKQRTPGRRDSFCIDADFGCLKDLQEELREVSAVMDIPRRRRA